MKDLIVFVTTGFEDTELIAALDVFNRNDISYDLVSIENKTEVKGKVEAFVKTIPLKEINLKEHRGVFLPGGPGHKLLLASENVKEIVRQFDAENKVVSAICAAPQVLMEAGILGDRKYTSFPGFALSKNNNGKEVVVSKNLITGRDFEATISFAKEVVKALKR